MLGSVSWGEVDWDEAVEVEEVEELLSDIKEDDFTVDDVFELSQKHQEIFIKRLVTMAQSASSDE